MKLCVQCARITSHEPGCAADPSPESDHAALDPRARHERVLAGMQRVRDLVAAGRARLPGTPREALEHVWLAQDALARYPASDLQSFDAKRDLNTLQKEVAALRADACAALPDGGGERIAADLDLARKALELQAEIYRRRREAATFDLTALGKLPHARVNYARSEAHVLDDVCLEVESRLAESSALQREVETWGNANLGALVRGEAPPHVPVAKVPAGSRASLAFGAGTAMIALGVALDVLKAIPPAPAAVFAALGVVTLLAGLVFLVLRNRRYAMLPAEFQGLGIAYRERLYLSAALRFLRRRTSLRERAEDAFRQFTSGESAARWKRLRNEERDAVRFFFDWEDKRTLEDALNRAATAAVTRKAKLVTFDAVKPDEWDALAKALALDLATAESAADEAQRFDVLLALIAGGDGDAKVVGALK